MINIHWVDTNLPPQYEHCVASLQRIKQWSAVKLFYRQHMPYARVSTKESIAVIYQDVAKEFDTDNQHDLKQNSINSNVTSEASSESGEIIAAIRVKHVGQYQLISGLLVAPQHRGKGLATKLIQFIAPILVPKKCFLFTDISLQPLYLQQQFQWVQPPKIAQLPANILQLYQRYHSESRPLIIMQLP